MAERFSKRYRYHQSHESKIIIREDTPIDFRYTIIYFAYVCKIKTRELRRTNAFHRNRKANDGSIRRDLSYFNY